MGEPAAPAAVSRFGAFALLFAALLFAALLLDSAQEPAVALLNKLGETQCIVDIEKGGALVSTARETCRQVWGR